MQPDRSNQSLLIAGAIFLVISIVMSAFIVVQGFSVSPTLVPTQTSEPTFPPDTPTPTATAIPTPTLNAEQPTIAIAVLPGSEDDGVAERMAEAFTIALADSSVEAVVEVVTLPENYTLSMEIPDTIQRDVLVLAAWGDNRLHLFGSSQAPPPIQLDETVEPWFVPMPERLPITVRGDGDFEPLVGMAVGLLEISIGDGTRGSQRIEELRGQALAGDYALSASGWAAFDFATARARVTEGDYVGALQSYSQALRQETDFQAAVINRANTYLLLGDVTTALAQYQEVLADFPQNRLLIYDQAVARLRVGDFDQARVQINRLIDIEGDSASYRNLFGLISVEQGNLDSALEHFQQAEQLAPGPTVEPILVNQALTLTEMGEYEQALAVLGRLTEIEPTNPRYRIYTGVVYRAQGDDIRAEEAFDRAIRFDPSNPAPYLQIARIQLEEGNYREALELAEDVLEIEPEFGAAYAVIGQARLAQEEWELAVDAFDTALEQGAFTAEVYAGRGYAYHNLRRLRPAIDNYEQAISLGMDTAQIYYWMHFALYDSIRYADSLEAIQAAFERGLDTADAYARLAIALDANVERGAAEEAYQEAIDLDPSYANPDFLRDQPLWSDGSIIRALTILRRLDYDV